MFYSILKIKTLCRCYQRHRALLHKGNNSYVVAGTRYAYENVNVVLRPQKPSGRGAQDGHLDFHWALSLWTETMDLHILNLLFFKSQTGLLSKFSFWDSSAKRAERKVPTNLCVRGEKQIGFCRSLPETHTYQEDGARVRRRCMLGFIYLFNFKKLYKGAQTAISWHADPPPTSALYLQSLRQVCACENARVVREGADTNSNTLQNIWILRKYTYLGILTAVQSDPLCKSLPVLPL